jgi:heme exporter protein CcmD
MTGHLQGGWEFVWAAYAITATVLVAYAASILLRLKAARKRHARGEG